MDPIEKQERKREAFRRLRAQRHRAGELRGRVVTISLIGFVLLWGVVFAQMATGNDPVLSAKWLKSKRRKSKRRKPNLPKSKSNRNH
jgi:GT2 family glycosyltransferase